MILAILQARVSSSRLPGKVLRPILGKAMLALQIERILRAKYIDKLIIATSNEPTDDALAQLSKEVGVECFRGSLNDVLDRFYQVANQYQPEHVVRLTGDCPLIDHAVIDKVIQFHLEGQYDYSSNTIKPTYPNGLDVEICRWPILKQTWEEAKLPSEREHVTLYIHHHAELFKLGSVENNTDLSKLRWTVDEPEDFMLVNDIYEYLYPNNPQFTTRDILEYYSSNEMLQTINNHYQRNEGLAKSLVQDKKFQK